MAKIAIDGKEYDTDQLSNEAKQAIGGLQFTEAEIQRLQASLATMRTARVAYARALQQALSIQAPAPAPAHRDVSLTGDNQVHSDLYSGTRL